MKKIWLDVPYSERESAAALGAAWDWKNKLHFIPDSIDRAPFASWIFDGRIVDDRDARSSFRSALLEAGLVLDGDPVMDGEWQRTTVSSSRNERALKGAYKAQITKSGANGFINNKDTGLSQPWKFEGRFTNPALIQVWQREGEIFSPRANNERTHVVSTPIDHRAKQLELLENYEMISETVTKHFNALPPASDNNAYLQKKGISGHGAKEFKGLLVVPIHDKDGKIWSAQYISLEAKNLRKGGKKTGCFFQMGDFNAATTVLFCEGFATGASLRETTGLPVVVCIDSGNLAPVIEILAPRLADKQLVICGEDDRITEDLVVQKITNSMLREKMGIGILPTSALPVEGIETQVAGGSITWHKEQNSYGIDRVVINFTNELGESANVLINNVGREKSVEAATTFGALCVFPVFGDDSIRRTDFNDLHMSDGGSEVRKQIAAAIGLDRSIVALEVWAMREGLQSANISKADITGKIIQNTGVHVAQDVGRLEFVAHQTARLDRIPRSGETVRIKQVGNSLVVEGQKNNRASQHR